MRTIAGRLFPGKDSQGLNLCLNCRGDAIGLAMEKRDVELQKDTGALVKVKRRAGLSL